MALSNLHVHGLENSRNQSFIMAILNVRHITSFVKLSSDKRIAILIVYVDDIILTGNYREELERLKSFLSKEFEIKDLESRYFLGMEIARSRHDFLFLGVSIF